MTDSQLDAISLAAKNEQCRLRLVCFDGLFSFPKHKLGLRLFAVALTQNFKRLFKLKFRSLQLIPCGV